MINKRTNQTSRGTSSVSWRLIALVLMSLASFFTAQAEEEVIPYPVESPEALPEGQLFPSPKESDTRAACKKYEGTFIGYYGKVYKIEDCKRRWIEDQDAVWRISSKKIPIVEVEGRFVAAIPEGRPFQNTAELSAPRTCKQLNKMYITNNFLDINYVEDCKLFSFPDYETYIDHRKLTKNMNAEVHSVSNRELRGLGKSKEVRSVVDEKGEKLDPITKGIDIIPAKMACKGLDGVWVSFVSRTYRIENCRKREIDAERLLRMSKGKVKLQEITAQQWLSIPDGKVMGDEVQFKQ
jgi:hypothetical protein